MLRAFACAHAGETSANIPLDPQAYENAAQSLARRTNLKGQGMADDAKFDAAAEGFG